MIIPTGPANLPPNVMAKIVQHILSCNFLPNIFGSKYQASNCCKARSNIKTINTLLGKEKAVMIQAIKIPKNGPKYGMKLLKVINIHKNIE